jgi:hypothetical protein
MRSSELRSIKTSTVAPMEDEVIKGVKRSNYHYVEVRNPSLVKKLKIVVPDTYRYVAKVF